MSPPRDRDEWLKEVQAVLLGQDAELVTPGHEQVC